MERRGKSHETEAAERIDDQTVLIDVTAECDHAGSLCVRSEAAEELGSGSLVMHKQASLAFSEPCTVSSSNRHFYSRASLLPATGSHSFVWTRKGAMCAIPEVPFKIYLLRFPYAFRSRSAWQLI